jgi:catechol 2,3-dioxygenase-like lactoylglutathione lyase family enzyme
VDWYTKHFGFRRTRDHMTMDRKDYDGPGSIFKMYGDKLHKVRIAWLETGNGVGFELFQFIDPEIQQKDNEAREFHGEYLRGGYFHMSVTAPDADGLAEQVCADGGQRVGETLPSYDGDKSLYLRDPWGNIVEVNTCSFGQTHWNR